MRRPLAALGLTALGVGFIVNFQAGVAGRAVTASAGSTAGGATAGDTTAGGTTAATGSVSDGTGAGTTSPSAAPASGSVTVTGPAVTTRYGPVQVQVEVQAGKLTDVVAIQLPGGDGRSVRINSIAAPIYRDEALQAQSASIDVLSGATFTWQGFTASLEAALKKAGV